MGLREVCEIVATSGLIAERELGTLHDRCQANGVFPAQILAEDGVATEATVQKAVARALKVPFWEASQLKPEPAAALLLDEAFCVQFAVLGVALRDDGGTLWLAMADPTDRDRRTLVQRRTGKYVKPLAAEPSALERLIPRMFADSRGEAVARVARPGAEASFELANERASEREAPALATQEMGLVRPLLEAAAAEAYAGPQELTGEELLRLMQLRESVAKSSMVLKALVALVVEKSVLTPDELRSRRR